MVSLLQVDLAHSEWYLSGYGGFSAAQPFKDVTMNNFGYTSAVNRTGFNATNTQLGDTLVQNFKTSDLSLKNSSIFGGKGGYFFNDQGLPWLGVELDIFTTNPKIKNQTVSTDQDIRFTPKDLTNPACPLPIPNNACGFQERVKSTLPVTETSLRLVTAAFNVVARYPGNVFQPYVGVGAGAFYFSSSTGAFQGRQVVPGLNAMAGLKVLVTEDVGLFLEGKYNRATLTTFDPTFGLSGEYSAFNFVAGLAYHF
jgi:outer membrane protein W